MAKKGKGGGGNDGGGSGGGGDTGTVDLDLIGSTGDDRMRGGDGNDRFTGGGGNDQINGGNGTDTSVYSGSVWDYSWREGRKGWTVDDIKTWDGDDGTDTLSSIEYLEFSDATVNLSIDNPTVIDNQGIYTVTYGETVDFTLSAYDYDNKLDLDFVGADLSIGRISLTMDRLTGRMGDSVTLNGTFDSTGFFTSTNLDYLAKGETITVTYDFELTSSKTFETNSTTTSIEQIEFVVVGVNEAPTFAADEIILSVVEDGASDSVDLSPFADDIDSDDTAASLIYELVSATDGFDLVVSGSELIYSPTGLDQRMTSDETLSGEAVLRVVDQHGATSDTIVVDLLATGADDPTPVYVTQAGVDFEALGSDPASAPNQGSLLAGFNLPIDPSVTSFTDGADVKIINATRVSGFTEGTSLVDANGVEYASDALFDTGDGDDVLVFDVSSPTDGRFELNDVSMGHGEDVLSVDVDGVSGLINGLSVDTGIHSDQIWIALSSDNGWINTDINTGSGHDIVEMQYTDRDIANIGGFGFVDASVSLGSGDDTLNITVDTGQRQLNTELNVSIYAGDGDDAVALSNAGTSLVIASGQPTDGDFANFYRSGLEGFVSLGDGDDTLVLDLNEAYASGAAATVDGGAGFDTLILAHLNAEDVTVQDLGDDAYRLVDGFQQIDIIGFEEITFADETSLFEIA